MKSRPITILGTLIFCLSASALLAQPATRPAQGGGRGEILIQRVRGLMADLNLSDEQKAQIKTILGDMRTKLQELREKAQGDAMQLRDGARQIFTDAREQLMGVLSPAQQQKLREMMQDAGQPPQGDRPPRGRANP